ncbi:MAG: glycosyltransferase family 4 protein [Gemmataceae bacterium]|nr:glycosyltransferase family 4 protein [Gemmataceae bacterium]
MKIALCYESVLPARGGCETYIADLARRLVQDRHEVHLFASAWDETALPESLQYHRLPRPRGPRCWRPWSFAASCKAALLEFPTLVSLGFNKTWGQDVLYPQGGLHVASAEHNLRKFRNPLVRGAAGLLKKLDVAHWSYSLLERRQYLGARQPLIVVNSEMVRGHFRKHYHVDPDDVHVLHSAIDPERFIEPDRLRRRLEWREHWNIAPDEAVALFVAMNYQLKGLEPLLYAAHHLARRERFRLLIAGHPKTSGYERLARQLGVADRVCFIGPNRDMQNCYFASDFLVHPTFYDPCSLVVLEALACGLPVITSAFNGASELLDPPHEGYVIDNPHDHTQLAWCMAQLLNPARRAACAQAARKTAARWTFDDHYRQLLPIFAEAALRKHAA